MAVSGYTKRNFAGVLIGSVLCLKIDSAFPNEILEADSDDPLLVVDQQDSAESTRLPNSHSAAFVMGLIFLCLFTYGAYKFCRHKCGLGEQPLTVNIGGNGEQLSELGVEGLEAYIKEREDYLAIYGPQRKDSTGVHVCEFKNSVNSSRETRLC